MYVSFSGKDGAWPYGKDYREETDERVIAIHIWDDKCSPFDVNWVGPVELTEESAELLELWARDSQESLGGRVHLLPVNGDAINDLKDLVAGINLWKQDPRGS